MTRPVEYRLDRDPEFRPKRYSAGRAAKDAKFGEIERFLSLRSWRLGAKNLLKSLCRTFRQEVSNSLFPLFRLGNFFRLLLRLSALFLRRRNPAGLSSRRAFSYSHQLVNGKVEILISQ